MKYCNPFRRQYVFVALMILALCSCSKKENFYQGPDDDEGKKPSVDELFDFDTQQSCHVNIDYCLKDYVIIFEIYDEDPMVELDGVYVKREIEAVYRASTDANGKFLEDIILPDYMQEAWLYTDYLGVANCVRLDILNHSLNFNYNDYMKGIKDVSPRATVANGYIYPDEFKVLGNWTDLWGTPDYLLDRQLPSADILYRVKKIYSAVAKEKIPETHPEFLDENVPVDLKIEKATKVYLTFLNNTASIKNSVGYFTYQTGTIPDASKIQKIIAFPHASTYFRGATRTGALTSGDRIQLKYWDGDKFLDEFPVGVSIGWFLIQGGYNTSTGNVSKGSRIHYSTTSLNDDHKRHIVALHDSSEKLVTIGFEDQIDPKSDWNYADAIFSFEYEVDGAVGELPLLPEDGKKPGTNDNLVVLYGTIVFEDQWPDEGDYDMNDVAIYYESSRYKNPITNSVMKCVDKFTVINEPNSANYQNGFGYQFTELNDNSIGKVSIEGAPASSYVEEDNLEAGQSYPTVILFDNAKNFIGKTITVTVEFNGGVEEKRLAMPYNPFIFVNNDRGRELHLATTQETSANYKPTQKASEKYWGEDLDMTDKGKGIYYVSSNLMPFAMHISGVKFVLPGERENIMTAYPEFSGWVQSKGKQNKNWYKNKQ